MGHQFGFVPDGILLGLAGARALGERGSEASFTVPLLRPPHGREIGAQELGDLRFLLAAIEEEQGVRAIERAHASLLLFERP